MPRRKVSKIGPSTLMISLPNKWVKEYGIKKGDELDVNVLGKRIILESPRLQEGKKAKIYLDNLNANLIRSLIYSSYRSGGDEIELFFNENSAFDYNKNQNVFIVDVIEEVVDRLVGVEILKHKNDYCLIKEISTVNYDEFENALRRIFISLISTSQDMYEATKNKDKKTLEVIKNNADKKINKLSDFCLRIVNKGGIVEVDKSPQFYAVITHLEVLGDLLIEIVKNITDHNLYSEHEMVKTMKATIESLYNLFCEYKKENLANVYALRKNIEKLSSYDKLGVQISGISKTVSSLTSEIVSLHLFEKEQF